MHTILSKIYKTSKKHLFLSTLFLILLIHNISIICGIIISRNVYDLKKSKETLKKIVKIFEREKIHYKNLVPLQKLVKIRNLDTELYIKSKECIPAIEQMVYINFKKIFAAASKMLILCILAFFLSKKNVMNKIMTELTKFIPFAIIKSGIYFLAMYMYKISLGKGSLAFDHIKFNVFGIDESIFIPILSVIILIFNPITIFFISSAIMNNKSIENSNTVIDTTNDEFKYSRPTREYTQRKRTQIFYCLFTVSFFILYTIALSSLLYYFGIVNNPIYVEKCRNTEFGEKHKDLNINYQTYNQLIKNKLDKNICCGISESYFSFSHTNKYFINTPNGKLNNAVMMHEASHCINKDSHTTIYIFICQIFTLSLLAIVILNKTKFYDRNFSFEKNESGDIIDNGYNKIINYLFSFILMSYVLNMMFTYLFFYVAYGCESRADQLSFDKKQSIEFLVFFIIYLKEKRANRWVRYFGNKFVSILFCIDVHPHILSRLNQAVKYTKL